MLDVETLMPDGFLQGAVILKRPTSSTYAEMMQQWCVGSLLIIDTELIGILSSPLGSGLQGLSHSLLGPTPG
jgi:hypothetical protein